MIKSASIILQKTSGEVLLCKKSSKLRAFPNFWVFPGGKISDNLSDDWDGSENEVFETIFQEMFEEIGVILGNSETISPSKRKGDYFSFVENLDTLKEIKSQMVYVGKKRTPPFGKRMFNAAYYWLQGEVVDSIKPLVDGGELVEQKWILPETAIKEWEAKKLRLPPPILHILRDIGEDYFISKNLAETELPIGFQTKIEVAPRYQAIPFESNTIDPFISTNLIVVTSQKDVLIVDPGAKIEEADHFSQFILSLPAEPRIFLTHHHTDHWESLKILEEIYPQAQVYAHPNTLKKITTSLQTQSVTEGEITIGDIKLQILPLYGHTDGHLGLYDASQKIVIAGDHVVGFGSAVLDPVTGNMRQYFESCQKLLELNLDLIIPAHGPLNFEPDKLLHEYIEHRIEREEAILVSVNNGNYTLDTIVKDVYQDVPEHLWEYAKHNIKLHLDKLEFENRLPNEISFKKK